MWGVARGGWIKSAEICIWSDKDGQDFKKWVHQRDSLVWMVQGQSKRGEIKLVWTLSEGRYWVHCRRNLGKAGGAGLVGERRRQRGLWMREDTQVVGATEGDGDKDAEDWKKWKQMICCEWEQPKTEHKRKKESIHDSCSACVLYGVQTVGDAWIA